MPHQDTPTFIHDCDCCTFLGNIHDEVLFDLYYCPQHGHPTVIARFGNDGRDYKSGAFRGTRDLVLAEAMHRAGLKGLKFKGDN